MMEKVYELLKEKFGENHPETLLTLSYIATYVLINF
jgi:hypothetical protein